jgi:hypothetical protein
MTRLPKALAAVFCAAAALLVATAIIAFAMAPRPSSAAPAPPVSPSPTAGPTSVDILKVYRTGTSTATIIAAYRCTGSSDAAVMWASVAQGANADADETLMHGKPSKSAVAWSQSSANEPDCDGRTHIDNLKVDQVERGFGTLSKGLGWVQVWLYDAQHPVGGEAVRDQEFRSLNKGF